MSEPIAEVHSTPEEAVTVPAPVAELRPKNTHRLNRIFRKPKSTVAPRPWRLVLVADEDDEEGDGEAATTAAASSARVKSRRSFAGVSLKAIREAVAALTESEKERAAAGQEPLSATQEELARRAARFGVLVAPAGGAGVGVVVDPEELKAREERFGTGGGAETDEAMQRRLARFGAATAPLVPQLSEEDKAAAEARALRFAS